MLIESNPLLEATSFGREREVRKHVGDYTLFVTGLFPESVARASRGNRPQLRTQRGGIMATGTVIYKCSREKRRIGRPNLVQNFCKQVTHLGLAFGLRLGKPAGRQRRHHGHARPPRAPRPRACHRSIITEVPPIYTLPSLPKKNCSRFRFVRATSKFSGISGLASRTVHPSQHASIAVR